MDIREWIGVGGLGFLFLLLALRIPVALAMFLVALVGSFVLSLATPFLRFDAYLLQFQSSFWNSVASYELSVVPLFILMGFLASESGLSHHLFQGMRALVGRFKGGVALAVIGACAAFGAVSGSSIATASTMSKISLPELKKLKYNESFSTGVLAAGGTLGILIPPSIVLVIYAVVVETSIIEMFQAAILPALIAVVFFAATILFLVFKNPSLAPKTTKLSQKEFKQKILHLCPVLIIFGIIILGLGLGIFTPTPAASAGVFLVFCYGLVLKYKTGFGLNWNGIKNAAKQTAKTTAMIYFILFAADIIKGFFSRSGLPNLLIELLQNSFWNPYLVLILMLTILILLGFFMESLSMILVFIPFFLPILIELNGGEYAVAETAFFRMDTDNLKLWFGILALVVVELGLITPPVGLNVFVIKSFSPHTPTKSIFLGVLPFFCVEILRILLLLAIPALCLFLPKIL